MREMDTMNKEQLGSVMPPMALPVCLVGANVRGRPNYCTLAWFTMIDDVPPTIGLIMAKERMTKEGIMENGTFSVNIPNTSMAAATDYVGIVSGHEQDKSEVFESFYGKLGTAPMIKEAPVTMECELHKVVEFETTDMVVGKILEVYADVGVMRNRSPDASVLDPLMYLSGGASYLGLGKEVAEAFKVGKTYHPRK